ncbi:phenylalanine--tRNA ligase subunit alpha [Spiroplasma endosymbiont of Labia minor]|uniref:phenylalanine--tRNA ligase subunit alpha n=1 Tax=Spiroplasma endosymbiont of Labia minor TaxID=3066305 RepID=UPI0030CF8631
MTLKELVEQLDVFLDEIKKTNNEELKVLKAKIFGKQGAIATSMQEMKNLSADQKKEFGQTINKIRLNLIDEFDKRELKLENEQINKIIQKELIDISLPGKVHQTGSSHILNQTLNSLADIFSRMGFRIIDGPEIEYDSYNFEMLNIPVNHPARDMQDTFYFDAQKLLRTHTSPNQIREMIRTKSKDDVLAIIAPGKVFRRDSDDQTHSHQFMQMEGLMVGKNINMGHLKGTLETFVKSFYGIDREIKFRASYFPFTEPSVEVDVMCGICTGKGCQSCHNVGWIEILGAGMVHPNVLRNGGYDPNIYSGFAFGMGIERITMLKYNIKDIRYFYNGDIKVLEQFKGEN